MMLPLIVLDNAASSVAEKGAGGSQGRRANVHRWEVGRGSPVSGFTSPIPCDAEEEGVKVIEEECGMVEL